MSNYALSRIDEYFIALERPWQRGPVLAKYSNISMG